MQATALAFQLGQVERFATFIADYFTFLSLPTLVPVVAAPTPLPAVLAGIRLENVHFTYPRATAEALSGLDLEVKAGELVAIVGENGAGKTTITNLLSRFYDPTSGRVVVSGIDARELDPAAWRARIGILLQDFVKYQLPLREAVQVGRIDRHAGDPEVSAALVAARADFASDVDRHRAPLQGAASAASVICSTAVTTSPVDSGSGSPG